MADYVAPLADMRFVLENIVDLAALAELPGFEHADPAMVLGILEESGRFFSQEFAPLNRVGDTQHSRRNEDGSVTTPDGFARAYARYVEAGWAAVPFPAEYGGGGFPWLVAIAMQEMMTAANMAFSLCPLLTQGAIDMLLHYGSEEQREVYLPKMVTGEWTGTMNLTEPQAGSDVGALTTKAVPAGDGSWRITGQKIFITYGEHDLADNIVHLVLARVPDAPPGTKGISCFIVPKFLVTEDGTPGERNSLECVSIEDKMGINASPTCVMAYDGRRRLPHRRAQPGHALHVQDDEQRPPVGGCRGAVAGRAGLPAGRRLRRRAPPGPGPGRAGGCVVADRRPPGRAADAADDAGPHRGAAVRWPTSTPRASTSRPATPTRRSGRARQELADLLTPITKGWGTDLGVELTSLAVQVHGGMGYIEETGVAQHYRDARIAPIYEGTNGIQAMDLVGRQAADAGRRASMADFLAGIEATAGELSGAGGDLATIGKHLADAPRRTAPGHRLAADQRARPTPTTPWPAPRPTCACAAS